MTERVGSDGRLGSGGSHILGLDGLRALAVGSVILYHANHSWLRGGFLGVEMFFVISGYLITLLLLRESERTGTIGLVAFWGRRIRRLLPALAVLLIGVATYLTMADHPAQARLRGDFFAAAAYFTNWYQIWVGQGYGDAQAFVPLRHLWSLAVEEQFYLLWPVVMYAVVRASQPMRLKIGAGFAGLAVLVAVVTGLLYFGGDVDTVENCVLNPGGYWHLGGRCFSVNDALYLGTLTRASGLLLGAAAAFFWRPEFIVRGAVSHRPHRIDIAGGAAAVGLLAVASTMGLQTGGENFGVHFNPALYRGGLLLVDVLTLVLIAAATLPGTWTGRILESAPLRWVGTRSYGLYLYHWPIFQMLRQQAGAALTLGQLLVALPLTVGVAEVSYRFVEVPIRRGALARWWRILRGRDLTVARQVARACVTSVVVTIAVVGADTATAQDRCATPTECAAAAGAAARASGATGASSSPAAAPSPSAPGAPAPGTPAPGAPAPGGPQPAPGTPSQAAQPGAPTPLAGGPTPLPAGDKGRPLAIGESVMEEAVARLEQKGITTNAQTSRQASQVIELLRQRKAADSLPQVVVIQVGTNGIVTDRDLDDMVSLLPADTKAYFMTVRAPARYVGANNQRIRALPTRHPNVQVIDWEAASQGLQLCPDQTHTSCAGGAGQAYTHLVLSSLGIPD